ncbi:MAG: 2-isopropylmalate synthase [Lentisphaeria bacterium]|nr:2-isopropylmalate synthase [Lentisphaeria bacterium]
MIMNNKYVEILDTTLRDGEQTPGVAFAPAEKLAVAKMLYSNLKVDRLEIGSARVSDGETDSVRHILDWARQAGAIDKMEILGFVDGGKSIDWIVNVGGKVINLLAKGSLKHCTVQLKKTPEEHYADVKQNIELAVSKGLKVNVYLEDWTSGMKNSLSYVEGFMNVLKDLPVERVMLPDTLGIARPNELREYFKWIKKNYPDVKMDFHGHNDYGLVTANSLEAINCGIEGIHTTVNGLGERTGNQPLSQLAVVIKDMTDFNCAVDEDELFHASVMIQNISGKRCAWNYPVVGMDVFTQTCGVHADGDKKGDLYANKLLPERFGRKRNYALGKLSGKASLDKNLEEMSLDLAPEIKAKLLQEIIRLGDKKKSVSVSDLPFLIAHALKTPLESRIKVVDYHIISNAKSVPIATVKIDCDGTVVDHCSEGDGGYDAFVKALRRCLKEIGLDMPKLLDYEVRIPPGGKTDALVETTITWDHPLPNGISNLTTTGVDSDQMVAAIIATEKMLNLVMQKNEKKS